VREFAVMSNQFTRKLSRRGAVVSVITRSGTNQTEGGVVRGSTATTRSTPRPILAGHGSGSAVQRTAVWSVSRRTVIRDRSSTSGRTKATASA
jgi:hypothetical protein